MKINNGIDPKELMKIAFSYLTGFLWKNQTARSIERRSPPIKKGKNPKTIRNKKPARRLLVPDKMRYTKPSNKITPFPNREIFN